MRYHERITHVLKDGERTEGEYVLYWMQSAQRTIDNHALDFAIRYANRLNCKLLVCFVIMPDFPNANSRHFMFMLQGLKEVVEKLNDIGAMFVLSVGHPEIEVVKRSVHAKSVVMDQGYGIYERKIRENILNKINAEVYIVDTNLVIPVHKAYAKEAYAAYAIRPSIMRQMDAYLEGTYDVPLTCRHEGNPFVLDIDAIFHTHLSSLTSVPVSPKFKGGQSEALKWLNTFISEKLEKYNANSSDPGLFGSSNLSPYLHFGHISPVTVANAVLSSGQPCDAFIEQLIVRRELAYNYLYYAKEDYRDLKRTLPRWAFETIESHRDDEREHIYDLQVLEQGLTHDPYWNAAQKEMVLTGHMHNTMRMYWGKKVIEWTESPEKALEILLYLNDKYELDGRDPNGYAGILWCFGKHDRPWRERPIFGKVRYMNAAGLKRKYNMKDYVSAIQLLEGEQFEK